MGLEYVVANGVESRCSFLKSKIKPAKLHRNFGHFARNFARNFNEKEKASSLNLSTCAQSEILSAVPVKDKTLHAPLHLLSMKELSPVFDFEIQVFGCCVAVWWLTQAETCPVLPAVYAKHKFGTAEPKIARQKMTPSSSCSALLISCYST